MPTSRPSRIDCEHVILTDVGKVRDRNEDVAAADAGRGIFLLADGMGGHPDGNLAAKIAIDTAIDYLTLPKVRGRPRERGAKLKGAILAANAAILAHPKAVAQDGGASMGTTMVCLWLGRGVVDVAHVGDSRIYRIRDGIAQRLTRDHTVVQALVDRGDLQEGAPEFMQFGHILTQAVGLDPGVQPAVSRDAAIPGDTFVLCSDGLSDLVPDVAIAAIVTASANDVQVAAQGLVTTALQSGGHDNVTVVVVRAGKIATSSRKRATRVSRTATGS